MRKLPAKFTVRASTRRLQWGRTLSSAEVQSNNAARGRRLRLQWGRTLSSAEVRIDPNTVKQALWLQWGRTLSSAEVQTGKKSKNITPTASMGPHSFKCGSCCRKEVPGRINQCFNGAALFQVRKFFPQYFIFFCNLALQWGRTLSSAEVENRRRACAPTSHPLQWGRTLSSAEVLREFRWKQCVRTASMGPHSFKCGSSR